MMTRLGIRQKLSLLLVLPLITVVVAIVPLAVERVDSARAGTAIARTARLAQHVNSLVHELQRERVLALAYLVLPGVDAAAVTNQQRVVADDLAAVQADVADPAVLTALEKVAELGQLRQQTLRRAVLPTDVHETYHRVVKALLDALNLPARPALDAHGLRELNALDALLRSDEQAGEVVVGLIIATDSPDQGGRLLAAGLTAQAQLQDRFHALADDRQTAIFDTVLNGPSGRRVAELVAAANGPRPLGSRPPAVPVDFLSVILSYGQLRHVAADAVVADVAARAEVQAMNGRTAALTVGAVAAAIAALVIVLSIRVSRSIASPLRRLAVAARAVADIAGAELVRVGDSDERSPSPPRLAAVNVRGEDEIGELGAAINRVQATAVLMLERQISTQENVAVIFANIAHRTQSLVSRQVELIDDMEQDERDSTILSKLYRLDHVTARLRRSADSLLVVSGTRDTTSAAPASVLDVVRAAMAEIEGFQAVQLGRMLGATVSAELAGDLRLLLAELLENATSFSPPGAPVTVDADPAADGYSITVIDRGIGMSYARIAEENQRMVDRPRLDVAPTEFLGLFVVGRLARRHGLTVRLNATPGGGVTAHIHVPARHLLNPSMRVDQAWIDRGMLDAPSPNGTRTGLPPFDAFAIPERAVASRHRALPAVESAPHSSWNGVPSIPQQRARHGEDGTRGGLHRRMPGATLGDVGPATAVAGPAQRRDPSAEASEWAAWGQGVQAAATGRGHEPDRMPSHGDSRRPHGLVRRVPGAQLDPAARRPATRPAQSPGRRDADADRASLDAFVDGLARAQHPTNRPH